jgi:transcriptional regulator with XRE-family HTH domain
VKQTSNRIAPEIVGEASEAAEEDSIVAKTDPVAMRVADRLRRARQLKGLTLAQVASRVGLSHNFLSMVERGMTDLSLSRFRRLAAFYGIPASELLGEEAGPLEPQITSSADGLAIDRGEGITYRLLPNQEFGVQVMHVRFAPRAGFAEQLSHEGADIAWVIRGKVVLLYGEKEYELRAGQCVSYKATVPHAFVNKSGSEAELVAVVTIPYW